MYVVCCSFGRLVFVAVYTGGGQVRKAQTIHYTVDLLHFYTKYRLKNSNCDFKRLVQFDKIGAKKYPAVNKS